MMGKEGPEVRSEDGQPDAVEASADAEPEAMQPDEPAAASAEDADLERGDELQALRDQFLRAQAEMENVRRRAARDVENAHKFALEKFTADLLPVLDSLEKAVEAAGNSGSDVADAVAEGIRLSLKLFLDTMEKAGVKQVDPLGEPFNPEFHEAMAMVPNPDSEPNSVMEVMQKGYTLNGRLVRAAKVIVVSGA